MTAAACLGLFTTRDAAATLPLLLSTAHAWSSQITSGLGLLLEGPLRLAHAVRTCAHRAYLVFAGVKVEGKLILKIVRMLQMELGWQLEVNMWFNYKRFPNNEILQ